MNNTVSDEYAAEMAKWCKERRAKLIAPDGFLSLVGLVWLKPGVNKLGSASGSDCLFPSQLPAHFGTVAVADDGYFFSVAEGVDSAEFPITHNGTLITHIQLFADADAAGPTIVEMGSISWFIIQRGEALGIRIRDAQSDTLQNFTDVERFALDEDWRVEAQFLPHNQPHSVPIPTILGTLADMLSPGVVRFTVSNEQHELLALQGAQADQLFLIIADATTGKESYGGGRFLMTEPLQPDGSVVIDFNKATNPPCAFSPYATCPTPPAQNRLPFAIWAGEKS